MCRRFQDGFEIQELIKYSTVASGGSWSIAVNAGAARTGGYGMEVSTTAPVDTVGAYVEETFGTGITYNAAQGKTVRALCDPTNTSFQNYRCSARFNFQTDLVSTGIKLMRQEIFKWSTRAAIRMYSFAPTGQRLIYLVSGGVETLLKTTGGANLELAVSTWYRFVTYIQQNRQGMGYVYLAVYTVDTNTLVGELSVPLNLVIGGDSFVISSFRLGSAPVTVLFSPDAHKLLYEDFAINDDHDVNGNGVEIDNPGSGAVLAAELRVPTTDAGATHQEWNSTGAAHWTEIDEFNPVVDTDYINTVNGGTGLKRDTSLLANYGGVDTVKSLSVLVKHRYNTTANNDNLHNIGVMKNSSGNFMDVVLDLTGVGFIYFHVIVDEKDTGGVLDNAYYDDLEFSVRRTANNGSSNNAKRISHISVEVEDDDGLSTPNLTPTLQRVRGQVV